MLLPVETKFDEESNTLYAETDRLGTYCVLDMEILMQKLGIAPDGTSVENVARQMYSAAPAAAKNTTKLEKYCVTFIFDIRKKMNSDGQLDDFIGHVIGFANKAFGEGQDITIRLMTQDVTDFFNDSYKFIGECTNIDEFNKTINSIKLSRKDGFLGDYCSVTDALTYAVENSSSNVKNYVFDIYDQTNALFDNSAANSLLQLLQTNTNHINISMISNFHEGVTGFQREITRKTSGININSSKDFGDLIYDHVFNDFPDLMNAILISGYEKIELKGVLNRYNGIDSDYEECAEGEDDLHKNDHLTDWEEVGVDHWVKEGLMSYDDDGNAVLPTIMDCLEFTELTYVEEGLKRFEQQLGANFGAAICGKRVLPVISDPTRADSDGDGIVDKYDLNPLMAVDLDMPCLYDKAGKSGVENHDMVVNFANKCKTYICTNPRCQYEVANPDFEDFTNLNKTNFVMVRTLISLHDTFCQMDYLEMAELAYSMVDKIRENCATKSYEYTDSNGDYVSPCIKTLSDDNDIYLQASIADYTKTNRLSELMVYGLKDVGDIAMLFAPNPILPIGWAFISEQFIYYYEQYNNPTVDDNRGKNIEISVKSTIIDEYSELSMPIAGAIVTACSVWSHIGIYITNVYELSNIDSRGRSDFKIRVDFVGDGLDNKIVYFSNIKDLVVDKNPEIDIYANNLYSEECSKKSTLKNAFKYINDSADNNPWAIIGSYYYKRDDVYSPWIKYHSKSMEPVK